MSIRSGKGGRFVEVVANISTSALDKMSGERSAVMFVGLAGEVVRWIREIRIQDFEQRSKRVLIGGILSSDLRDNAYTSFEATINTRPNR
jgi:hypothetical protein